MSQRLRSLQQIFDIKNMSIHELRELIIGQLYAMGYFEGMSPEERQRIINAIRWMRRSELERLFYTIDVMWMQKQIYAFQIQQANKKAWELRQQYLDALKQSQQDQPQTPQTAQTEQMVLVGPAAVLDFDPSWLPLAEKTRRTLTAKGAKYQQEYFDALIRLEEEKRRLKALGMASKFIGPSALMSELEEYQPVTQKVRRYAQGIAAGAQEKYFDYLRRLEEEEKRLEALGMASKFIGPSALMSELEEYQPVTQKVRRYMQGVAAGIQQEYFARLREQGQGQAVVVPAAPYVFIEATEYQPLAEKQRRRLVGVAAGVQQEYFDYLRRQKHAAETPLDMFMREASAPRVPGTRPEDLGAKLVVGLEAAKALEALMRISETTNVFPKFDPARVERIVRAYGGRRITAIEVRPTVRELIAYGGVSGALAYYAYDVVERLAARARSADDALSRAAYALGASTLSVGSGVVAGAISIFEPIVWYRMGEDIGRKGLKAFAEEMARQLNIFENPLKAGQAWGALIGSALATGIVFRPKTPRFVRMYVETISVGGLALGLAGSRGFYVLPIMAVAKKKPQLKLELLKTKAAVEAPVVKFIEPPKSKLPGALSDAIVRYKALLEIYGKPVVTRHGIDIVKAVARKTARGEEIRTIKILEGLTKQEYLALQEYAKVKLYEAKLLEAMRQLKADIAELSSRARNAVVEETLKGLRLEYEYLLKEYKLVSKIGEILQPKIMDIIAHRSPRTQTAGINVESILPRRTVQKPQILEEARLPRVERLSITFSRLFNITAEWRSREMLSVSARLHAVQASWLTQMMQLREEVSPARADLVGPAAAAAGKTAPTVTVPRATLSTARPRRRKDEEKKSAGLLLGVPQLGDIMALLGARLRAKQPATQKLETTQKLVTVQKLETAQKLVTAQKLGAAQKLVTVQETVVVPRLLQLQLQVLVRVPLLRLTLTGKNVERDRRRRRVTRITVPAPPGFRFELSLPGARARRKTRRGIEVAGTDAKKPRRKRMKWAEKKFPRIKLERLLPRHTDK